MRHAYIFVLIVLAAVSTARAQDGDVIKVESSIVRLNVGVVDAAGRPITQLNRDNFTVYEDGVKQQIQRFEPTVSPFSVVMLLDMSGSTKSFRQNIQLAATRFVDALGPDDRVAVIEFYRKVNVLNDFTTDRKTVVHSISVANGEGETNLYKALQVAMDKLGKEQKRRKAIVVLTDGIDTQLQAADRAALASLSDENQIADAIKPETSAVLSRFLSDADRQAVTVYPLALPTGDPKRLPDPTPKQFAMYQAARNRLQILADRSGGSLNAIDRLEDMGKLYSVVAAEIHSLYTIEYEPANDKRNGKWRTIRVEMSNPALIAKTRPGYNR
jgi:VWFA-related protein